MSSKRNRIRYIHFTLYHYLEPQQDFEKTFVNKGELDG